MHGRIKKIRAYHELNQERFAESLGIGQSTLAMLEVGKRDILDRHIKTICSIYNVDEDWLRTGEGKMFVQQTEFSLDGYAKKNNISELEIDIIKSYMEVDANIRNGILSHFKNVFASHAETAATTEIDPKKQKLIDYELELDAEEKGETFSASHMQDETS